jgi:hypothetical protein
MKQFSSPSLVVSSQVDDPSRLEGAEISVAANVRVLPPAGALRPPPGKEGNGVAMQATSWTTGASPYPTNTPPKSPSTVDADADDEGNATALGSGVLSLEYISVQSVASKELPGCVHLRYCCSSILRFPQCCQFRYSVDGEEIEIDGLAEPFVLELDLDEAAYLLLVPSQCSTFVRISNGRC